MAIDKGYLQNKAPKQFQPTYLYIKQHTITGKFYFGKTTKPYKKMLSYNGSGTHWKNHIKKHGLKYVITLWYRLYNNIFDLVADALSMSKSFDIKNSNEWLNILIENGLNGSSSGKFHHMYGKSHSKETRIKISKAQVGNPAQWKSGEENPCYGKRGKNSHNFAKIRTEEVKEYLSKINTGILHPQYGTKHTKDRILKAVKSNTIYYNFVSDNLTLINISTKEFSMLVGGDWEYIRGRFYKNLKCKGFIRIEIE